MITILFLQDLGTTKVITWLEGKKQRQLRIHFDLYFQKAFRLLESSCFFVSSQNKKLDMQVDTYRHKGDEVLGYHEVIL